MMNRGTFAGLAWLSCLLVLVIIAACGGDDGNEPEQLPDPVPFTGEMVMPTGWQGIWEMNFDLIDEDTGETVANSIWIDTLCVGDTLSLLFGPLMQACDGYVRGDSLIFSAATDFTEGPCTLHMILELQALRTGDLVNGDGEWRLELSGDCASNGSVAGRQLIELTGQRTGDVPDGYCD